LEKINAMGGDTPSAGKGQTRRRRLKVAAASLLLVGVPLVGAFAASAPASASIVPNYMRCEPDTGWCYQVNPPVNNSVPHYCRWDYTLHNLHSGMWYTGCDVWQSSIH
jgi:hypothetical protein